MFDKFSTNEDSGPSKRRKKGKPHCVVRHHSVTLPMYAREMAGKTRYTISFYRDGRRQRRTFTDLEKAKKEAKLIAEKILRGMQGHNDLKPAEREAYFAAQRMAKEQNTPLVSAMEEWANCRKLLGDVPLRSAVEEFLRRTSGVTLGIKMAQVVEELIAAKEQDGMSRRYRLQLQSILGIFAKAFPGPIMHVKAEDIDSWLRASKLAPISRNNRLTVVRVLFNFAKQRNYVPASEKSAAEMVAKVKVKSADAEVFTPEEMEKLLLAAPEILIPFLAIGGFAGLRVAEISRLDWKAVDMERRMIQLRADQAKTASRRIVPMSDNLVAWLNLVKDREGPVMTQKALGRKATVLARKIGLSWPNNVLRHSYISYRVATIHNANQVALEAGNSPAIIFKHYRELVTGGAAGEWFSIMPPDGWVPPKEALKRRPKNNLGTSGR